MMNDDTTPDDGVTDGAGATLAMTLRREPTALAKVETQGEALAAAAARETEVRFALARRFPREIDVVERRLLADCRRPGFAERSRYARPVGGDCKKCDGGGKLDAGKRSCDDCLGTGKAHAHGFSIRFAEAALAALGNLDVGAYVIYQDASTTRIRCYATDMETNASWKLDADVPKTVERKKLKRGQQAISERTNSWGDRVYVIPAEPAEHDKDCGAATSKRLRELILRLVPADVKEACEAQVKATLTDEFRKQAAAVVARLVDAFGRLKPAISRDQLAAYLGHPLEQLTEAEYLDMRAIFTGVSEGHTTWATLVAEKRGDVEQAQGEPSTVDKLRADLQARAAKRQGSPQGEQGAAQSAPASQAGGEPAPSQPQPQAAQGAAQGAARGSRRAPTPAPTEREPGSDG